jgi:internalin A
MERTGRCELSRRSLTRLPPEITQLTNLQELLLSDNRLTALPPEIGQLTNLQVLRLNGNELTALPPEIGQLTNLQVLRLDGNELTALPPEIGQLTNLQILRLDGNELTTLPPEIGQLTKLQTLSLGANQLTALPAETGQLTSLRTLTLRDNQLTTLPPEIGQLTNLQTLSLSDNKLTALPRQLADLLAGGLGISLEGNVLRGPIEDMVKQGARALAAYLSSLEDAVPLYEAKVLLVGEGNVGKTSLIAALRGDPFVEGRATTHGIEIRILTLRDPGIDAVMTARAWDFGGQEVYRITHQFFFSPGAVYLIVWKPREGQEQNEVEGWLRRIRLRVKQDARAFIVATHCSGERHADLDYPHMWQLFPELLAGRYEVDSCTGLGVAQLRKAIAVEAAKLPQMGQLISPRWVAVQDEIGARADTEPQISYEQFAAICQRHQVVGDEIAGLARLLHVLGRIIHYGDDEGLRDFVVLNPEWLTKAISYVLEDEQTRQNGGVLEHARLREIWQRTPSHDYLPRHHPYFLRLMEKFDVSYRLEDDDYHSLVAQLVPHDRPALSWEPGDKPPSNIRRVALVCRLSETVPGLIAWLTVRHHRSSTGKYWRNGVFLRHPIEAYASEALVELRTPDQLAVEVRAPSPDYFFSLIRGSLEDLMTRRWPGLAYELLIPCPGITASQARCSTQIPLNDLLVYREEGESRYLCTGCRARHDISALLTGFAQPALSLEPELDRLHEELADIHSGLSDLKAYAADTADAIRRIQRAVSTEITDCPRLFTLKTEKPSKARRLRIDQRRYRLVLWCEHPGHWHPWPAASYILDQPSEWLTRVTPYATLVVRALQLVTPIAGSLAGVLLTPGQLRAAQSEIQLMTALVADLPGKNPIADDDLATLDSGGQLTSAQGQAWRALRLLLFEHDRTRVFGGLSRMQDPSGEFLWICPDHYADYDPGLPAIPVVEPPLRHNVRQPPPGS